MPSSLPANDLMPATPSIRVLPTVRSRSRGKPCLARAAALWLALLFALPALAKEREGVTAPPTIQVEGKTLNLMGMGLRKKLWVKVYLASFYLENPTADAEQAIASEQTKRVQMNMLRDLDRGKIVEAVQQGFERNTGDQLPRLQERLDRFLRAIPDLKGGQTIVITYFLGKGTLIKPGLGEEVAIPGKDFADALFSVWVGKSPVDDELKQEMLANRRRWGGRGPRTGHYTS